MALPSSATSLLIPFAGHLAPACQAALASLRLPNLDALLTRLAVVDDDAQPASSLSPPHERALARALGMPAPDGCIGWAAREAQQTGLSRVGSGEPWAMLTLCHWEVAIDQVVLDDPSDLFIDEAESQALLEAARPFFQDDGIALRRSGAPGRWLARGELFRDLPTASVDRAAGGPIAEWAPLSDALKPVRKLQNEMQMLLYTQRVNDERIARGLSPINSFWLSGTGVLPTSPAAVAGPVPTVVDTLRVPALRDDGAGWAAAWRAIDAGPVAALLASYREGAAVELTLCGDRSARRFGVQARGPLGWVKSLFGRTQAASVLASL